MTHPLRPDELLAMMSVNRNALLSHCTMSVQSMPKMLAQSVFCLKMQHQPKKKSNNKIHDPRFIGPGLMDFRVHRFDWQVDNPIWTLELYLLV